MLCLQEYYPYIFLKTSLNFAWIECDCLKRINKKWVFIIENILTLWSHSYSCTKQLLWNLVFITTIKFCNASIEIYMIALEVTEIFI